MTFGESPATRRPWSQNSHERQSVKAGLGGALFVALDYTSAALVFGSKGSFTLLQEQVDVVVLLFLPSCNCCAELASIRAQQGLTL